jgi:hypothetical protein
MKNKINSKYKTEVGERFSRLEVTSEMMQSKDGHYRCEVKCDCGNVKIATVRQLIKGLVVSCGCKRLEGDYKHGMHDSRPMSIYGHMKARCDNENEAGYAEYGGRGISYNEKWSSFIGFWEDMQEGYSDDLELDRIDPYGNYCKENCRWVDHVIQCFNTRKRKDNTSGKSGVSFNKKRNLWETYISIHKQHIKLGYYQDLELAIHIREEAELKYYGFIKE